jgi:hypothetical protein
MTTALERAPRFPIRAALRYRWPGERRWHQGLTENVSRSGVLFRTNNLMPVHTPIEMLLNLPLALGGGEPTKIFCRGRVVRIEATDTDATQPASIAATIVDYRIARVPDF